MTVGVAVARGMGLVVGTGVTVAAGVVAVGEGEGGCANALEAVARIIKESSKISLSIASRV